MDAQSRKNLSELLKILRKNGVESFKSSDFDITLRESLPKKPSRVSKDSSDPVPDTPYSDEQILLWSTYQTHQGAS